MSEVRKEAYRRVAVALHDRTMRDIIRWCELMMGCGPVGERSPRLAVNQEIAGPNPVGAAKARKPNWRERYVKDLGQMTNDQLFVAYEDAQQPDDWGGDFTDKGVFARDQSAAELVRRLRLWGFLE